jgi:hypothetical protein
MCIHMNTPSAAPCSSTERLIYCIYIRTIVVIHTVSMYGLQLGDRSWHDLEKERICSSLSLVIFLFESDFVFHVPRVVSTYVRSLKKKAHTYVWSLLQKNCCSKHIRQQPPP